MITKETFIKLINTINIFEKEVDKWNNLGLNMFETKLCNSVWELIGISLKSHFTEQGYDWIYYYLYEEHHKVFDDSGKEIPLNTADDLWELIKEYRL